MLRKGVAPALLVVVVVASAAIVFSEGGKPLAEADIEKLLQAGVTAGRIAALVEQRGVSFETSRDVREKLRAAGATDQLLGAVERASLELERRRVEEDRKKLDEERKARAAAPKETREPPAEAETKGKAGKERAQREKPSTAAGRGSEPPRAKEDSAHPGMVFVPGGPFFMGCNASVDTECDDDEKPGKTVDVGSFWIDKTEVTAAAYKRCADAGSCSSTGLSMPFYDDKEQPEFAEFCTWQKPGRENHPINCVDWNQAVAYCASVGKRLPTEPEWEKAARGTDGRKYPWGNAGYGSSGKVANIADESAKRRFANWTIAAGYDDGYVGTAPVGSFPAGASPYGALDMIGNVFEWTADTVGGGRALRGGSWYHLPRDARASYRGWVDPAGRIPYRGFRCAQ